MLVPFEVWSGAKHSCASGKNEAKLLRDCRSDSQRSLPREKDEVDVCFASQPGRAQQVSEIFDRQRPSIRRQGEQDLQGDSEGIAVPESLPRSRGCKAAVPREGKSHEVLPQLNAELAVHSTAHAKGPNQGLLTPQ